MSYYYYKMIEENGLVKSGFIELPNTNSFAVRDYLGQNKLTVVTVRRLNEVLGGLIGFITRIFHRGITSSVLREFLRHLGVMLRSGVPLMSALKDASSNLDNPSQKWLVEDLQFAIRSGLSLSQAVERHPRVFSDSVRYMIRIGEETGNLDKTLMNASDHLDRLERINVDTRRTMIYPSIVFIVTIAAAAFWMYYVVPDMVDLFKQMKVELPEITKFLIATSEFLRSYTSSLLVGIVSVYLFVRTLIQRNSQARYWYHRILLRMPISKVIVRSSSLAFIFEYLSLLISSGINISRSLEILSSAISNEVYKRRIQEVHHGLALGNSITREFEKVDIFPNFVIRMINTGEQSGHLSEQLEYIAEEYRFKLKKVVDNLSEIIRPVAILVVGGLFIFIIAGLFLPIYQLIDGLNMARY